MACNTSAQLHEKTEGPNGATSAQPCKRGARGSRARTDEAPKVKVAHGKPQALHDFLQIRCV